MKRIAGLLLAVLMICSMIPFASVTVAADDIVKDEPEGIVEIKGEDTPPIEVEGLKEVLEDNEAVITEEDKEKIENGQISIEVVFEAEEKSKRRAMRKWKCSTPQQRKLLKSLPRQKMPLSSRRWEAETV